MFTFSCKKKKKATFFLEGENVFCVWKYWREICWHSYVGGPDTIHCVVFCISNWEHFGALTQQNKQIKFWWHLILEKRPTLKPLLSPVQSYTCSTGWEKQEDERRRGFLTQVSQRSAHIFTSCLQLSCCVLFVLHHSGGACQSRRRLAGIWLSVPNFLFVTPLRVSFSLTSPSPSCWPLYIPVCLVILLIFLPITHLFKYLYNSGVDNVTGPEARTRTYFENRPGHQNTPSTGPVGTVKK